ncbi:hypothetical protein ACOMHN_060960 [Nucella lapillus]
MSDMGLMVSTSGTTITSTPTTIPTTIATPPPSLPPTPPVLGTSPVVKTSRLSQDLASVGIVSSRQHVSLTASTSAPDISTTTATNTATAVESLPREDQKPRPESYPGKTTPSDDPRPLFYCGEELPPQVALPAVVMDHGNKRKPEMSSARMKAEEILRRKGEPCELPHEPPHRVSRRVERTDRQHKMVDSDNDKLGREPGNESSPLDSPLKSGSSPQSRLESSPIAIQEAPARQSGSPQRTLTSPSRQSSSPGRGSPSRISGSPSRGSPNRLSGSPSRGPLINPGSPKSTVSGVREREGGDAATLSINRRASKVNMEDFPEDDDPPSVGTGSGKTEEKESCEEKPSLTQPSSPSPDLTAACPSATLDPNAAAAISAQTASGANANPRSRLGGLKRLSPKGSFNIISFFDRLLLPAEKASTTTPTTKKEAVVSECDSEEQLSSIATATSSTTSSSAPSPTPTPPESLHTSSSAASTNSSPRHSRIPTSQSRSALNRGSRIPKRQTESPSGKTPESSPAAGGRGGQGKTEKKKTTSAASSATTTTTATTTLRKNATRASPSPTPTPIPVPPNCRCPPSPANPQVDINANSPEYRSPPLPPPPPSAQAEEMVVEHSPIGQWGCSSSETGQSDASGQSVSMEEDQSRCVLQSHQPVRRVLGGGGKAVYK